MSSRKRHTASLDFMRLVIANERLGGWLFEDTWRHRDHMIEKLLKRGWVRYERSPATYGSRFYRNHQRRNYLKSTKKGRRAVYVADRHSAPNIRLHDLGGSWWRSIKGPIERDRRSRERLARVSTKLPEKYG